MGEVTNRFSPAKITDSPDTILGLNPTNDKYDPWLAVDEVGNVWVYNKDTEVWKKTTTTLQEAIDAQEDKGEVNVDFVGTGLVSSASGFSLYNPSAELRVYTDQGGISFHENSLDKDVNGDPWVLTGYGENSATGIGGDYSSLRPDAIVPKAYVDNKVFTGITNYESNDTDLPGDHLRRITGTVENAVGVLDGKIVLSSLDSSTSAITKIQQTTTDLTLFSLNGATNKQVTLDSVGALQYRADYSADYSNRTLTDKGYVDTKVAIPGYPSYASTAAAAADGGLAVGSVFKVTNGDGTSAIHIKD